MPFLPTTDTLEQVEHKLIRNTLGGLVIAFGLAFGMCIYSTSASDAAAVAILPALFAAPFVGGLITVISYSRAPEPDATAGTPI